MRIESSRLFQAFATEEENAHGVGREVDEEDVESSACAAQRSILMYTFAYMYAYTRAYEDVVVKSYVAPKLSGFYLLLKTRYFKYFKYGAILHDQAQYSLISVLNAFFP